jgi:hypothetical protein
LIPDIRIVSIKMDQQTIVDMPQQMLCPCGGGQSCIVDRRWVGDWVHEDDVFVAKGLPVRTNCFSAFSKEQEKAMDAFMEEPC